METTAKAKAPGLTWRDGRPIWRASRTAIKAGFKPVWVNLSYFANDEAALVARCHRLTAEANEWVGGRRGRTPVFDGTIGSLINYWQTEPTSAYHELEPATLKPYNIYSRIIVRTVGQRRIDALDGRDLKRWHREWSAPIELGGKPRLAAGRMAMAIIKAALKSGISCRLPGCAELKLILQQQSFAGPRPRTIAPTAAEIISARKAAHDLGHWSAALAYALQFEGAMRQWDVIGKWVPLPYKQPSSIIDRNKKWIGPMWSQIDPNTDPAIHTGQDTVHHGRTGDARSAGMPDGAGRVRQGPARGPPWPADRQPTHHTSLPPGCLSRTVAQGGEGRRYPAGRLESRSPGGSGN